MFNTFSLWLHYMVTFICIRRHPLKLPFAIRTLFLHHAVPLPSLYKWHIGHVTNLQIETSNSVTVTFMRKKWLNDQIFSASATDVADWKAHQSAHYPTSTSPSSSSSAAAAVDIIPGAFPGDISSSYDFLLSPRPRPGMPALFDRSLQRRAMSHKA